MPSFHRNRTIPMEVDADMAEASAPSQSLNQNGTVLLPLNDPSSKISSGNSSESAGQMDLQSHASIPVTFPAMNDFNSSASMLSKGWEEYMNDAKGMQFDSFKRFFGNDSHASDSMSELKDMILDGRDGRFYTPLALRHTHSTPLQKAPSILDEYAMRAGLPPPIPLVPPGLQRMRVRARRGC